MKKLFKLFICALLCTCVFLVASCSHNSGVTYGNEEVKEAQLVTIVPSKATQVEGKSGQYQVLVGYFSIDIDAKLGKLYLVGANVPDKTKYIEVYTTVSASNEAEALTKSYSIPNVNVDENTLTFAGWYVDEAFTNGKRVASTSDDNYKLINDQVLYGRYINYGDAGLIAVVCVIIVFAMLALLFGIVSLFKFLPKGKEKKQEVKAPVVETTSKKIAFEDIKDEDMMAAALVASIDYHNETGKDVRVVSVEEK